MDYIETKLEKKRKRINKIKKNENVLPPIEVIHSQKIEYFKQLQDTILPQKE